MTPAKADDHPYKISDLIEMTGVGREAVRFYINEGLLPPPHKTARNMAWYSSRHVELIRVIRNLQEERFLPLKVIKSLLDENQTHQFSPRQMQNLLAMREQIDRSGAGPETRPRHDLKKLTALLRLDRTDIAAFRELGLIRERSDDVTAEEESLLTLWANMRDAGLTRERGIDPQILDMVVTAVDGLFAREVDIFESRLRDMGDSEAEALIRSVIPDINRMFVILHQRAVRSFISRILENGGAPPA